MMRFLHYLPAIMSAALVISFGVWEAVPVSADELPPDPSGVRVDGNGGDSATGIVNSRGRPGESQAAGSSRGGGGSSSGSPGSVVAWRAGVDPASVSGGELQRRILVHQREFLGLTGPSDYRWDNIVPLTPRVGSGVDPAVLAREASGMLRLPGQVVRVGPDPSLNEWNMLAVGFPVWLWWEGDATVRQTVSLDGVVLEMVAVRRSTTFVMGDGTSVSCSVSRPWKAGALPPGSPSPSCGYVYVEPGDYTITATHNWELSWSALGQSGVLPMSNTSSVDLEVGELASVIVER